MSKTKSTTDEARIRILLHENCPKLTSRGKGLLAYELGVNDATKESFVRIAENSQGGTCSSEWINLQTIKNVLEPLGKAKQTFSATLFAKGIFISRSQNNHGFLAAVLKAEKVIENSAEHATQLTYISFSGITSKIKSVKNDVDLTDHVAIKRKNREEQKAQRQAKKEGCAGQDQGP